MPPGLSLPQDFPPLAAPSAPPPPPIQRKTTTSSPIKPAVPVRPSTKSKGTAKGKQPTKLTDAVEQESTPTNDPVPPEDVTAGEDQKEPQTSKADSQVAATADDKVESSTAAAEVANKKQKPDKIDIAAARNSKKPKRSEDASTIGARERGKDTAEDTNTAGVSQPSTPVTAGSQASATSVIRGNQPRAIRIPSLPKAEPSPPTIPPSSTASKHASRQPSISSINRPATPSSERVSDNVSLTSTSISRTNSPPPLKVGSASVRQVTKSQQKKERQARAKQIEGSRASTSIEEPPAKIEEVQAPVLGRKKKTKKDKSQGASQETADSTPTVTRPSSPAPKEDTVQETAPPVPATPVKESKKPTLKSTAGVKGADSPSSPATPAPGEQQQKASNIFSGLFAGLLRGGEISSSTPDLFKPVQGLNHRIECIDFRFTEIEDPNLSDENLELLEQGEAIQYEKAANNHVIMLPDGRELQGLNETEAARYIELRNQTTNINGNIYSHRIFDDVFPPPPPSTVAAALSSTLPPRGGPGKPKKLINKFDIPLAGAGPDGIAVSRYGIFGGSAEESLMTKKATLSSAEAEQALGLKKKDTEALEKKLNGLVKRNKKTLFVGSH